MASPVARPTRAELDALPAKDRQDLWDAHRQRPFHMITSLVTSLGVLLGVLFTAFGLAYTAKTLQSAREGQITDRYARAVEQLGSPAVEVRVGGVYALERLAADSPADRTTIRNVLAAFVRNHDFCRTKPLAAPCTAPIRALYFVPTSTPLPTDVRAAFTAALALPSPADFSQTRFPRLDLPRFATLRSVDWSESDLVFASFSGADLRSAVLRDSCLTYANLTDAHLAGANLTRADLYFAQLSNADLTGADLRGADLRNAIGLTQAQLRKAVTDQYTRLGEVKKRPESPDCGPHALWGEVLHAPAV